MKSSTHRRISINATRLKIFTSFALLFLLIVPFTPASMPHINAARKETETKTIKAVHTTQAAPIRAAQPEEAETPHTLAASFYNLQGGFDSTLTLNNKGAQTLEVQSTLFNAQGEAFALPILAVEATSFRVVDLREYAPADFQRGNLQVLYHGMDLELGGQVKIVQAKRSLIFDEQLVEPATMFASARLEGVWWLPSHNCEMRLVMSNTTDSSLTVTARVDGSAPQQREPLTLILSPHETRVLNLPQDIAGTDDVGTLKEIGGISLAHTGAPGALLARGLTWEAASGYSSSMQFVDPQKSKSAKLHGAGLRLGRVGRAALAPVIVARNTSETETILTGRVPYTTNDNRMDAVSLPKMRLAPGEIREIDTAALRRNQLPPHITTAGLEFEYTTAPGSVVMLAESVSHDGNQVFRVPLLDPAAIPSGTGGYPWSIAGDSSTIVYVKNVTAQPLLYNLQLNFAGGVYALGLKMVAGGQTVALDLRALRDHQVPDARGRTLPPDAASGQVNWSVHGSESQGMIGRAEQVDLAHGLASTYACFNCCPDSFNNGFLRPNPIRGFPGDQTLCEAMEVDQNCYGALQDPFQVSGAAWSSSDAGVATVDGAGLATAQNVGSANIRASWETLRFIGGVGTCRQSSANFVAEALCQVNPSVRISGVSFIPTTIARTGGSTTLRVQTSTSTGVPSNTQVLVEAFQNTNPNGVRLNISPTNGQNGVIVSPGTVETVEFMITTSGANTASGAVTYAVRILSATPPPGSNVTVGIGPSTPANGVSGDLAVQ